MKKTIVTIVALFFVAAGSFAQGRFSVGPELLLPQGDWSDGVGMGIGGSLRYERPINDNLSWMATVGYISFAEKDDSGVKFSMIPVLGGAKYYFTESFNGFYVGAEAGFVSAKAKVEFLGQSVSATDTEFGFGPQVGYHISVLDISARYLMVSDANSIGIRVAYVFGGK